ncbi:MAG: RnfH family protein [Betaproteobacteria bacterium]|nr:RnfH family protein [Betaproteobacteria bacterium]
MKVLIVLGWAPRVCHTFEWHPAPGATVQDALQHLPKLFPPFSDTKPEDWHPAVWGNPVAADAVLQDGDRLEWLRALRVDPKVARRERFQQQGARVAGLFATRRPGAKQGY